MGHSHSELCLQCCHSWFLQLTSAWMNAGVFFQSISVFSFCSICMNKNLLMIPSQKLLNLYTFSEGSQSSLISTFPNMHNGDKIAPQFILSLWKCSSLTCVNFRSNPSKACSKPLWNAKSSFNNIFGRWIHFNNNRYWYWYALRVSYGWSKWLLEHRQSNLSNNLW